MSHVYALVSAAVEAETVAEGAPLVVDTVAVEARLMSVEHASVRRVLGAVASAGNTVVEESGRLAA